VSSQASSQRVADCRTRAGLAALALSVSLLGASAFAQYPGQVSKDTKKAPELRAVAVLEWTGEAGKPKACRIVPVSVLDGGRLEDGGIYLARPQPLALAGEVEYQLEDNGKKIGLFDIENSGLEQGSWVGYGTWKPMPAPPKPKPIPTHIEDTDNDQPVLHRKKHADDKKSGAGSGSSTGGSGTSSSGGSGSGSDSSDSASNAPPSDPDRPVLKKKSEEAPQTSSKTQDSGAAAGQDDPDRPKLKKNKKAPEMVGNVESLPDVTDPDRPRLKRGKSEGSGLNVAPSLMGLPPDMEQAVAVSDVKDRPDHVWAYAWANPADEAKMKAALEDMARDALGLKPPPPSAPKRAASAKSSTQRKSLKANDTPAPPPLTDEQFRVFELAYGSGATMVLTAHTDGPKAQMKFVTLFAQPDLYGNIFVLLKNVTDGAHLDENPRMRLVDAVDAMADNRGELLFELRGETMRQFALYRVLRGQAEKLFVSSGGEWGVAAN
jgi:hypothetical protein